MGQFFIKRLFFRSVLSLVALGFLVGGANLLPRAVQMRDKYHLVVKPAATGAPPEYVLTSALLGGFRGIFLTVLWVRGQNLKQEGKFYEMVQIYNLVTTLEPHFTNAWAFAAWDLAFNVSVEIKDDVGENRTYWVFRGVDLLRKQGIPRNPRAPELYHELAWIFYFKIGQDTDFGHPYYRRYLAGQMQDILLGPGSKDLIAKLIPLPRERGDLLAEPVMAQAAARLKERKLDLVDDARRIMFNPPDEAKEFLLDAAMRAAVERAVLWTVAHRLRTEVGMEPAKMKEILDKYCKEEGVDIDWRLPHAHSLYWSYWSWKVWRESEPKKETLKYERIIYFSLIMLVRRGRLIVTEDGMTYGVPDYSLVNAVIEHMDWLIAEYKDKKAKDGSPAVILVGARSGYENFLRSCVFWTYFDERTELAEKCLAKLREIKQDDPPKRKMYSQPLEAFVQDQFGDWLESPNKDRAISMLNALTVKSFFHLSIGDMRNYRKWKNFVEFFFEGFVKKRWDPTKEKKPGDDEAYFGYIPANVDDLRYDTLVRVFIGGEPQFSPTMVYRLYAQVRQREPALFQRVQKKLDELQDENQRQQALRRFGANLMFDEAEPGTPSNLETPVQ